MKHATFATVTVRQAALQLGHTQKYIRDLLYEKKLAGAYKEGRVWRVPADSIKQRLKDRETRPNG